MYEHRTVGPNLKSYFYYTNEVAEQKNSKKGVILIASGIEGTGKVYDEIGDYLDTKGYAMYSIDELGYGKTGKMGKGNYKNWKMKDPYYAAYNIHALSIVAKREHPDAPITLIGNDFGGMLSIVLLKEFPEIIDRLITIGYGLHTKDDTRMLIGSWFRKAFLYDNGESKYGHFSKNKFLGIRFETGNKYSWLSRDHDQVKKIVNAGFIDTRGTVGHYYYYYLTRFKTPPKFRFKFKDTDKNMPILFMSGDEDLLTLKGRKTIDMQKRFNRKHFPNAKSIILPGRHELLFEKNRFDVVNTILHWIETDEVKEIKCDARAARKAITQIKEGNKETVATVGKPKSVVQPIETTKEVKEIKKEEVKKEEVKKETRKLNLQEAEDELQINTYKDND